MKITRNQLRQLIQEEINLLNEDDDAPQRGSEPERIRIFKQQRNIPNQVKNGRIWGVADKGRIALLERSNTDGRNVLRHTGYVFAIDDIPDGIYKILSIDLNSVVQKLKYELVTFARNKEPSVSTGTKTIDSSSFSMGLKDGPDFSPGGGGPYSIRDVEKHVMRHRRTSIPGSPGQATDKTTQSTTSSTYEKRSSGGGRSSSQSTGTSTPRPSSRPSKPVKGAPRPKTSGGR